MTTGMNEISNQDFVEKYSPICNERFPTQLLNNSILSKYAFQRDEYALIAEYIRPKQFFTIISEEESTIVVPGLRSDSSALGYIITNCPYRAEELEYTVVEFYMGPDKKD